MNYSVAPQYESNNGKNSKRRLLAPEISLNLDRSEGSMLSDELDESTELDLDGIDTPSDNSNEFEWEGKSGGWNIVFDSFLGLLYLKIPFLAITPDK